MIKLTSCRSSTVIFIKSDEIKSIIEPNDYRNDYQCIIKTSDGEYHVKECASDILKQMDDEKND